MMGPLAPYASGFYADLANQGYSSHAVARHMVLMSQASQWMAALDLEAWGLVPEVIDQFLVQRRVQGRKRWISPRAVAPSLDYLRRLGVVPMPKPRLPSSDVDKLLYAYQLYLETERGLAPETVRTSLHVAHLFTSQYVNDAHFTDLAAADVASFVVRELRGLRPGSAQVITKGARAFLRFLHVEGIISKPLDLAVPKVASWRDRTLPRALEPEQVECLLASCNRTTPVGLRDYAILTILVRLGLRAGEVAALKLADIDWRRGEITIHGKGNRVDCLPLPVDVGETIVAWLQRGRPQGSEPHVFTQNCAPRRGLTPKAVSSVVHSASIRAGLPPLHAHRLRHTAATQMLRAGVNLTEIGQVLRHRNLSTSAIYAKVDRTSLSALARPWPGGVV